MAAVLYVYCGRVLAIYDFYDYGLFLSFSIRLFASVQVVDWCSFECSAFVWIVSFDTFLA